MLQSRSIISCLFVALHLIPVVLTVCPSPSSLPVNFNSTHYLGAYYYNKPTCDGPLELLPNGYSSTDGQQYPIHALVVRPGCVVKEVTDLGSNERTSKEYPAGIHVFISGGTTSHSVTCDIAEIDCQPSDEFLSVVVCDATEDNTDRVCTYNKNIGTSYSTSVQGSMALDAKLEKEMKETFWEMFSSELKVSTMTEYNWTSVQANVKGQPTTFPVQMVAAAGYIEVIDQVVGHCGGSHVRTEFFRTYRGRKIQAVSSSSQASSAGRGHTTALASVIIQVVPILWMTTLF